MITNRPTQKLKGFSLLEMIVSMGIIGIVMAMLSNVLVLSIQISQESLARSFVREEVTNISNQIINDIREAEAVIQCDGEAQNAFCQIGLGDIYTWEVCTNPDTVFQRCEKNASDAQQGKMVLIKRNGANEIIFVSSPSLALNAIRFEPGFDSGTGSVIRRNVLFTIVGSHKNPRLNVKNVLRQSAISTRNYLLK